MSETEHSAAVPSPAGEAPTREDVLALEARCESCGASMVSPTTGRIAGSCVFCGGRMIATKGAWSMTLGTSATPAPSPPAAAPTQREEWDVVFSRDGEYWVQTGKPPGSRAFAEDVLHILRSTPPGGGWGWELPEFRLRRRTITEEIILDV